ncbi:MAG: ATP-binding protein [Blastocatellia bacterium]
MTYAEQVVRLMIDSQLPLIDLATSLADNLTNLAGFDEDSVYWINMAVRESVANAVEHGNKYDSQKQVEITFVLAQEQLTISVRDHGEGFDPTTLPDPLDPLNLLNPAGRGILYMRTFMDEVTYQRHPEGGMLVTMAKRRQPLDSPAEPAETVTSAHLEGGESIGNVLGD